jgi:hypothetical protein
MKPIKLITTVALAAIVSAAPSISQAQRRGFAAPPRGETRFVAHEVVLSTQPNVSAETLTAIARRNRLTRMESQDAILTGLRFYRWRINSGASVAATIRALVREPLIASAQPNYVYRLQQGHTEVPGADDLQYALDNLHVPEAHRLATGKAVLVAVIAHRHGAKCKPPRRASVRRHRGGSGRHHLPDSQGTQLGRVPECPHHQHELRRTCRSGGA